MKKLIIPSIVLSIFLGCGSNQNQETVSEQKSIKVTTAVVKSEKILTALRYSGTIEAFQSIPLTFSTTGTVEKVLVNAGDEIKKGQLLASLDQTDSKNMYQIALAKYKQAQDAYDRLKTVYDKGSLPEIKWVEMQTNLEQAKSSLEISKNNLDKCNMYAPTNGFVGKRNIEPGISAISISSAPIELVDIKNVFVKISLPENEVAKIKKGMKASFTVSALSDKGFEGEVSNISPVADMISRTYEAKILVVNPKFELKPGMVCDVKMEQTAEKEMITVPYQSVSKDENNQPYVFVVDLTQKKVKKQNIKIGTYNGNNIEILSGLVQGQVIVKEGKEKLTDNGLIVL